MLDFRNANSLWASVLVETLVRLGLRNAVVCPGSRSTPLALALALYPEIVATPVLDERSASFFALGLAKASRLPVAVVCTSGSAGANFYPAVIEARESRVPLLMLTADRPPELRDCASGQTIDQQKLFGDFPNGYSELALPEVQIGQLHYLRQTLVQAWTRSRHPVPGPVHLNCPFRDPLPPVADGQTEALEAIARELDSSDFFAHLGDLQFSAPKVQLSIEPSAKGLIIAGPAQPADPEGYCRAIAHLSQSLGWPVLAEGLSPLRNYGTINPQLIANYDGILRNREVAARLTPDQVIQIGPLPTSKVLRQWLGQVNPNRWIVDPGDRNLDALHGRSVPVKCSIEHLSIQCKPKPNWPNPYTQLWLTLDARFRQRISEVFQTDAPIESKLTWLLSQHLPSKTPLIIANSMPVRDVEYFWQPGDRHILPYFNRGANGIDGTLSTALGIAQHHGRGVLLTGDLALLHDTNGFLIRPKFQGHLTILLVNNSGGGIFEMLPVSQFEPPFEDFFAMPQAIAFADLCQTYGVDYALIKNWDQLIAWLNPLPLTGIRLLELQTNRKTDARWRQDTLNAIARDL